MILPKGKKKKEKSKRQQNSATDWINQVTVALAHSHFLYID